MTALRELAERWNQRGRVCKEAGSPVSGTQMIECAAELLAILDAEDDGGAAGELDKYERVNVADLEHAGARIVGFRIREGDQAWGKYGLSEPLVWLHNVTHPHPARSGVVSDEDVEAAIDAHNHAIYQNGNNRKIAMRAALEHFAKGERHER